MRDNTIESQIISFDKYSRMKKSCQIKGLHVTWYGGLARKEEGNENENKTRKDKNLHSLTTRKLCEKGALSTTWWG